MYRSVYFEEGGRRERREERKASVLGRGMGLDGLFLFGGKGWRGRRGKGAYHSSAR